LPQWLDFAIHFVGMVALMGAVVTLAFYGTHWFYTRVGQPPELAVQLINTLLGVLGMALVGFLLGKMSGRGTFLKDFLAAMDRIAAGDFNVRLETKRPEQHYPLREIYERFDAMASGLERTETMRREFVANVSHEIRTPLTSIMGFAQTLRREDTGAVERAHYLDVIEQECLRLSRLSDALLKLAALDSGHALPAPSRFRLDKQLRHVLLATEPQWTEKKLDIEVEAPELEVTADPELLEQVWINLLGNAIKFTPEGGRIRVSAVKTEGGWEVAFQDSGIGIAPEHQARLFERFFKVDASRRSSTGGNGLGLAIALKIVELHGGKIAVRSALGEGTTMTVLLSGKSV
jgi:signal transduction histidine kinase